MSSQLGGIRSGFARAGKQAGDDGMLIYAEMSTSVRLFID
jgi:hypothetical protein